MADGSSSAEGFRVEARDWIASHLPASLKGKPDAMVERKWAVAGYDYPVFDTPSAVSA